MYGRPVLKTLAIALAAAIAATAALAPAGNAATYKLNFTSSGGNAAWLKVDLNGTVATSATGWIDGYAITGLSPYASADQQLFVAGPVHFTVPGLSFAASNGVLYNLTAYPFNSDRITNNVMDPGGYGTPTPYALTSLTVAAVPVPAPVGMLLAGLGALAALRRRRSAKTRALAA